MTEPKKSNLEDLEALRKSEAAGAHVMAARNALRKGERPRAKELLKQAFAASPGDVGALELLGDMYLEEAETEKALELFERAAKAHPEYVAFEEKRAVCRLDLAQMEADKIARSMLLTGGDVDKSFERSPSKAVSLSIFVPGAGQFYNDEDEKGAVYLAAGIVSFLCWFYPLFTALSNLPKSQRLDFGAAIQSMSGFYAALFYVGATVWFGVYVASLAAAGTSAKKYNEERRASLGL